ncbi:hypothetical protein ACOMHN_018428 [Nucella lapillus]
MCGQDMEAKADRLKSSVIPVDPQSRSLGPDGHSLSGPLKVPPPSPSIHRFHGPPHNAPTGAGPPLVGGLTVTALWG